MSGVNKYKKTYYVFSLTVCPNNNRAARPRFSHLADDNEAQGGFGNLFLDGCDGPGLLFMGRGQLPYKEQSW